MSQFKFAFLIAALVLTGCSGGSAPKEPEKKPEAEKKKADEKKPEAKKAEEKKPEAKKADEKKPALEPGKFHFDFPVVESTSAKKGDKVFYVNMKMIRGDLEKGRKPGGTQILLGTMEEPGSKESVVKTAVNDNVPNAGIIPIPAGQEAKVGDIVAGKWAVNMTRGYVTDASNPKAPKAVFIGLGYDNPAKGPDKKTGIGQFEYELKENEFMVISKDYDPGTACVYKEGGRHKLFQVWRAEGDMVIGKAFTTFKAVKKADCKPIPLKTSFKAGDKVFAPFVGSMKAATITKVGKGRYGIKYESGSPDEKMISFGEVVDKLD